MTLKLLYAVPRRMEGVGELVSPPLLPQASSYYLATLSQVLTCSYAMNLMADSGAILRTLMPLPRQSDLAPPSRIICVNPPMMHILLLREAWT